MTQEIFEGEELLRALQDTEEDVNITHPSIEAHGMLLLICIPYISASDGL